MDEAALPLDEARTLIGLDLGSNLVTLLFGCLKYLEITVGVSVIWLLGFSTTTVDFLDLLN